MFLCREENFKTFFKFSSATGKTWLWNYWPEPKVRGRNFKSFKHLFLNLSRVLPADLRDGDPKLKKKAIKQWVKENVPETTALINMDNSSQSS